MKRRRYIVSLVSIAMAIMIVVGTLWVTGEQKHFKLLQRIAGIDIQGHPPRDLHFLRPRTGTADSSTSGTPGVNAAGTAIPPGMPHVQGSQIVDGIGQPLLLRGAQMESAFAYYLGPWPGGPRSTNVLNSTVFTSMVRDWKMNVLRLPLSNWIYARYPKSYLSQLDTVIQQANAAGLYVVLDLHDMGQTGSPYGDNADMPKVEDVTFWKAIAGHYKNNSMVMFDLYNEPKSPDWATWLHGGGTIGGAHIVGFQDLIMAVRSVGAKQLVMLEPGSAGGTQNGWKTFDSTSITDPNVVYSLHTYDGIANSVQQDDALWGPILYHHPIIYGEWALTVNGAGTDGYDHCKNIPPDQADTLVRNFLNYMTARQASWVAWQFEPYHLIQDYSNFTPTTLDIPWTCGDSSSHAGMGTIVKQFMQANA